MSTIKFEKTLEERIHYSTTLKNKYTDRIPVIIEKDIRCRDSIEISKNKYLFPRTMNISEIITIIRKNIKMDSSKAIFIFVDGCLVPMNNSIESIYNSHANEDGFLYVTYTYESTFGGY